jgi:hypothetical protein
MKLSWLSTNLLPFGLLGLVLGCELGLGLASGLGLGKKRIRVKTDSYMLRCLGPPPEDHLTGVNVRLVELDPNAPPPPTNVQKKLYTPILSFYEHPISIEGQYFLKSFECKNRQGLVRAQAEAEAQAAEKSIACLYYILLSPRL